MKESEFLQDLTLTDFGRAGTTQNICISMTVKAERPAMAFASGPEPSLVIMELEIRVQCYL